MKRYRELLTMFHVGGAGSHIGGRWMDCSPSIFDGILPDSSLGKAVRGVVERHEWSELLSGSLYRALAHPQPASRVRQISSPTLVLTGDRDLPETRRTAMVLAGRFLDAELTEVSGAGHLCLLESPAECATRIAGHLRAHTGEQPA